MRGKQYIEVTDEMREVVKDVCCSADRLGVRGRSHVMCRVNPGYLSSLIDAQSRLANLVIAAIEAEGEKENP